MSQGRGTSRRSFFGILSGAIAAPIVVRSGVLMPVKAPIYTSIGDTWIGDYLGTEDMLQMEDEFLRGIIDFTGRLLLASMRLPNIPPAGQLVARASGNFAAGSV